MLTKVKILVLCCIALLCFGSSVYAQRIVEATGSSLILDGAQNLAKENAIKNAMQQALMQTKAHIDSTSTISSNVLIIDSARVNTSGTVEDVKILDEWLDEGHYFVRIRASIPEQADGSSPSRANYRKKIAFTQFDILHRNQAFDLPDLERKLPREIARRLVNSSKFIGIDATKYLISNVHPGLAMDNPEVYRMIADNTGAQIILSGQVRDLRVIEGFFHDKRHFEVDIFLHDGISGVQIARHRFSEMIEKAGRFRNQQVLFSNASFYQTVFGKALNRILTTQIDLIKNDLASIPFSARIIKIEGQQVIFDAGASSMINIGDVLMTFRVTTDPLRNINNQFLGHLETPVASLSVDKVQPQFSIGMLEIKNANLTAGDIVRFGR